MKKAFTLIELVIVIVILGIVAAITSGIIANTFTASRYTTSLNRINLKVELALNEIANRLDYAIVNTVIKRSNASGFRPIDLANSDDNILEWIGYDVDSFDSVRNNKSGWSGFCDLSNSVDNGGNSQTISTPGSDLTRARTIMRRFSDNKIDYTHNNPALFFPGNYDYDKVGYSVAGGLNSSGVSIITATSPTSNTITINNPSKRITQKYKLAWTAYAVVPVPQPDGTSNLELRYNFRPWLGEEYNDATHKESVLVTGVTVFKTYATQNRIHLKLCVKDNYGVNKTTSICKEKVIYK